MFGEGILGGIVMLIGVTVVVCLLSALFLVLPVAGSRKAWRDVCDVLCFLVMLVMGMVIVFVFSV